MSVYITSKKVRYMTAIIFVLFMAFIVSGSYYAQQEKAKTETPADPLNNL